MKSYILNLKSLLMRTPLGAIAMEMRWRLGAFHRFRHPELWEMYLEEKRLPLVLTRLLSSDSCIADVGAHLGSFLRLALRYAPHGRHFAFEASPSKAKWIKAQFPEVNVFSAAVTARAGVATFYEDQAYPANSSLNKLRTGLSTKVVEVPTVTLDDALADVKRLDLLKLDIEGEELNALCGGLNVIKRLKPAIIFECGTVSEVDHFSLFHFITTDLDYRIFGFADFLFDKGPVGFDEFRKYGMYPFRGFNFVALSSASEQGNDPRACCINQSAGTG